MSRAQLTSTVEQNTGGAAAPVVAGKNALANGAFDWWQRGVGSFSAQISSSTYGPDRFLVGPDVGTSYTASQITTSATLPTGFRYGMRIQRTAGQTSTSNYNIVQALETQDSIKFAGQTVTLSFWARANAGMSNTSAIAKVNWGTGTDQNAISISGWTGVTSAINTSFTLTTSWKQYTFTGPVGSTATQVGVWIVSGSSGTAGANDYWDITGIQLEQGSVATPFSRAGGTLQGELALCQRYYFQVNTATNDNALSVVREATTSGIVPLFLPVTMRTVPTVSSTTGTYGRLVGYDTSFGLATANLSAMATRSNAINNNSIELGYTSASMAGTYVFVQWDVASNAGLLGLSAEL